MLATVLGSESRPRAQSAVEIVRLVIKCTLLLECCKIDWMNELVFHFCAFGWIMSIRKSIYYYGDSIGSACRMWQVIITTKIGMEQVWDNYTNLYG